MIEEGQEYTTPIYDEDGNLIEVIEDYDVFLEDETSEEEHDDAYYLGEEGDLAEEDFAEEENVDHVESRILAANEKYQSARDSVIERLTAILEKGEISAEDNAELSDAMHEYTDSVNDMKDKLNEDKQGNNDTNEINQGSTVTVLPEELQHLIDLMNNGGRNDLLFVDEEGRVLVEGEQVPKLKLIELEVEKLVADYAEIEDLVAKKATIEDLNVIKAQIGTLEADEIIADIIHGNIADIGDLSADIGEIQTLVGENLTMENIASLILTSKKVTVEDAFIKDAMIDSVNAKKINAGTIDTNLVNLASKDGSMTINGSLQQFKDVNGKVRIQMGKDAQGNFTFGLFDSTGTGTLIDSNGITEKAIGDGLIVDKMVGDNANISGSKLDIDSVVAEVNNGTSTIKGSKVKLDEKNQTLEVAFSSMDTAVTEQGKAIGSHTTSIETMQGQIGTLISDTEILEGGNKVTVKDAYSKINQKVGEFGVSLKDVQSDFNNMVIGGRNLLFGTGFDLNNNPTTIWANYAGEVKTGGVNNQNYYHMDNSSNTSYKDMLRQIIYNSANKKIKPNSWYTLSFYVKGTIGSKVRTHVYPRTVYTANKGFVDGIEMPLTGDGSCDWIMTDEWVRHTYTFYTNSEDIMTTTGEQAVLFRINAGTVVDICMPQLEEGNKVSDWSKAQEDTDSALTSIDTRVKEAETKLTPDGLTTIIGSTYITPTVLDNKGYATTSDVTQSSTNLLAKFSMSGGYNLLYNGNFKNSMKYWYKTTSSIDGLLTTTASCPENQTSLDFAGQLGKTIQYYQEFEYDKIVPLTFSMWEYRSTTGSEGTTNPYNNVQISINYTDGTWSYHQPPKPTTAGVWEKVKCTIQYTKRPKKIMVSAYNRDTTYRMYYTNLMLEEGETYTGFTPHPSEVYDGVVDIGRSGIIVSQSNYNGYTSMRADGFYLNDGNGTDVMRCNSNGLYVKGQVHVISGSISEGALAGTLIDGQYIKTGTIQANSISIGDFNNYCTQPTNFTITAGSDTGSPGYKVSGTQHMFITSKLTQLRGGEQFSITGKAYGSSTNTTQTNLNFQFIWRDASGNAVSTGGLAAVAVNINTTIDVNLVLTVPPRPQNAIYGNIKIFVGNNIETLIYFQPNIRLMMTGNLIVDGAIDGKTITGTDIIGSTFSSKDGLFTVKEDGEVAAWALSAGIISAGELSVKEISNPQYPKSLEGNSQVYINPKANPVDVSTEFEDGGTYLSFADLEELSPRNLNGYELRVRMMTTISENVVFDTFNNGIISIEMNGKTLNGYVRFIGPNITCKLYGDKIGSTGGTTYGTIMPNSGCHRLSYRYGVLAEMCDLILYDLKIYKSVVTDISSGCILCTDRTSAYIANIIAVNEPYLMLRCHSMSTVYLASSSGMTTASSIHAVSGSIITVNTTLQTGRKGSTSHIYTSGNGQVFASGVTWDGTSQSGSNDSTSNDKVTKTVTVKSTSGDTYRSTYKSWKKDGTVRQGNAYGSGNCDGFWFFGSSLSTYLAKNPTAITITVTRQTGGSGSDVNLTMITHNHTSRPSGAGTVKETLRTFKAGANKSTTITLSSAEIAKLKNYKGVGLKTSYSATNYAVCSGTCTIKVTYEE